jgi:hypothetical protein
MRKVCLRTSSFCEIKKYLDFSIIVVHDIIVDIALIFFIDLEEVSHLFGGKFFALGRCGFVVHHFVELTEGFGVVLIWVRREVHFSRRASKSLRFLSTELEFCIVDW